MPILYFHLELHASCVSKQAMFCLDRLLMSVTAGVHLMYGVHLTRHLLQDSDALAEATTEVASAGESCDERLSQ